MNVARNILFSYETKTHECGTTFADTFLAGRRSSAVVRVLDFGPRLNPGSAGRTTGLDRL